MITKHFTLNCNIDSLSKDIFNRIKEKYYSTVYVDKTDLYGENSRCQIDTYQINSFLERGYITINIYFWNDNLSDDLLSVKISVFPPAKDTSMKSKKILKEIENIILSHK